MRMSHLGKQKTTDNMKTDRLLTIREREREMNRN